MSAFPKYSPNAKPKLIKGLSEIIIKWDLCSVGIIPGASFILIALLDVPYINLGKYVKYKVKTTSYHSLIVIYCLFR